MGGGPDPRIFQGANTTAQWYEAKYSRSTFAYLEKFLLHTTETTGWPGYSSGAVAPTATYHPRLRAVRQHNYVNTSARALVDPTSTPVRENRDRVVQLEIVCYSDRALATKVGGLWVGDLTDAHYRDIAALIVHCRKHYDGPPLVFPPRANPRMGSAEYDAFKGILGHDDASGNTHWDPGAFSFPRLINAIKALEGATPITVPEEDDMPYSPEQIKEYAGVGVHNQKIGRSDVTIATALERTYNTVTATAAQMAALTAALTEALAQASQDGTVDIAAVQAAAKAGAQEALAGYELRLEPPAGA